MVVKSERVEGFENSVTDLVAQLVSCHFAVQARSSNEVNIVNPFLGALLQNPFNDKLPNVRLLHRRQWQRQVIKDDGDFHPALELSRKWVSVYRVFKGLLNG